ncbi:hypothetical protein K488DRAFT_72118 [Vararia minispora EC-137]|uniref:Uncharacterized protein n=1 Tax=Vararia minispora EC-137 TaxID=1314806 RepID=A0ACB8QG09_9AGAM|nr:hypothetical protein K488DRAFT_72118 [Vararia minispora EC-137]
MGSLPYSMIYTNSSRTALAQAKVQVWTKSGTGTDCYNGHVQLHLKHRVPAHIGHTVAYEAFRHILRHKPLKEIFEDDDQDDDHGHRKEFLLSSLPNFRAGYNHPRSESAPSPKTEWIVLPRRVLAQSPCEPRAHCVRGPILIHLHMACIHRRRNEHCRGLQLAVLTAAATATPHTTKTMTLCFAAGAAAAMIMTMMTTVAWIVEKLGRGRRPGRGSSDRSSPRAGSPPVHSPSKGRYLLPYAFSPFFESEASTGVYGYNPSSYPAFSASSASLLDFRPSGFLQYTPIPPASLLTDSGDSTHMGS